MLCLLLLGRGVNNDILNFWMFGVGKGWKEGIEPSLSAPQADALPLRYIHHYVNEN